jgi:uncharacterized NAD-dependent epimerase/dehydratase family protein
MAHDRFGPFLSKTAVAVIRYGRDRVVAAVDRSRAPADASEFIGPSGEGIPVVASVADALEHGPEVLYFGYAPEGGGLPDFDRQEVKEALSAGVDVVSGLHHLLGEDQELVEAARAGGARIVDLRRPPARRRLVSGEGAAVRPPVVLVTGTDCSTGKMTVALEMVQEARRRGLDPAFVATGQGGMAVGCDAGASIDAIPGDFMAGEAEALVLEAAARGPDLVVVEGQGALSHPAYGSVALAILQGSFPDALVMCHHPTRRVFKAFWGSEHQMSIPPVAHEIALTERLLLGTTGGRVVAVAVMGLGEDAQEEAREEALLRATLELPVSDVLRDGPGELLDAVLSTTGGRG